MANRNRLAKQERLDARAAQILSQVERERRTRNIIIASFVALILGGGAAIYFLANPPKPPPAPESQLIKAAYSAPDEGHQHVEQDSPIAYKHVPPSSGNHYPSPKPWAPYNDLVAPGYWLHNLEHGGIVLVYNCEGAECGDLFSKMTQLMTKLPQKTYKAGTQSITETKFVSSPFVDRMPKKFALLAWTKELDFDTLNDQVAIDFFSKYVDHGREDIP